jgi:hypothetical protein
MKKFFLITLLAGTLSIGLFAGLRSCLLWASPYEQLGTMQETRDSQGATVIRNRATNRVYLIRPNGRVDLVYGHGLD